MKKFESLTDRQILYTLIAIAFLSILVSVLSNPDYLTDEWLSGLTSNLGTELIGAVVTYFMFEIIMGTRRERRNLLRQLGSRVNEEATRAAEELAARNWLYDGSLQKLVLNGANLQRANLKGANLRGVRLRNANLSGSDLEEAELQGASLYNANLTGANIRNAKMQGAGLSGANLEQANLSGIVLKGVGLNKTNLKNAELRGVNLQGIALVNANLHGANLTAANLKGALLFGANLQDAVLDSTRFDEYTALPDSTDEKPNFWAPKTDMGRFIDPNHPDFWRSDDPNSPASGNKEKDE